MGEIELIKSEVERLDEVVTRLKVERDTLLSWAKHSQHCDDPDNCSWPRLRQILQTIEGK